MGGAGGVLLANWLIHLVVGLSGDNLPRVDKINLDLSVLLFAVCISVLTAVLSGLVPALQQARVFIQEVLKEASHTATAGFRRSHAGACRILRYPQNAHAIHVDGNR